MQTYDILSVLGLTDHAILTIGSCETLPQKYSIVRAVFSDGHVVAVESNRDFCSFQDLFVTSKDANKFLEHGTKFDKVCHCSGYLCSRKNDKTKFRECITDWSI
jgi:hypothetical protein